MQSLYIFNESGHYGDWHFELNKNLMLYNEMDEISAIGTVTDRLNRQTGWE